MAIRIVSLSAKTGTFAAVDVCRIDRIVSNVSSRTDIVFFGQALCYPEISRKNRQRK